MLTASGWSFASVTASQVLLGHADLAYAAVYLHLSRRHLQAVSRHSKRLKYRALTP
jgi:site-specific recombinase XerD